MDSTGFDVDIFSEAVQNCPAIRNIRITRVTNSPFRCLSLTHSLTLNILIEIKGFHQILHDFCISSHPNVSIGGLFTFFFFTLLSESILNFYKNFGIKIS